MVGSDINGAVGEKWLPKAEDDDRGGMPDRILVRGERGPVSRL